MWIITYYVIILTDFGKPGKRVTVPTIFACVPVSHGASRLVNYDVFIIPLRFASGIVRPTNFSGDVTFRLCTLFLKFGSQLSASVTIPLRFASGIVRLTLQPSLCSFSVSLTTISSRMLTLSFTKGAYCSRAFCLCSERVSFSMPAPSFFIVLRKSSS